MRNLLTSFDAVSEAGGQGLVPRSLASSRPMPGSEACSFINPVTCFLNGPTCVPSVISIKLDGAERRATLNFDQRTNQAAIPDMEAFLSFFDIDVALIKALKEAEKQTGTLPAAGEAGSAAMGVAGHGPGFTSTWVDEGRTLLATFPDQAFVALYSVGAAGQLSLRLRPHECKGQVFGGHLSLRLSEPGQYTVDLSYASANGSRVSWGPMFEASWVVHACNDYVVQISRPSKVRASCPSLLPFFKYINFRIRASECHHTECRLTLAPTLPFVRMYWVRRMLRVGSFVRRSRPACPPPCFPRLPSWASTRSGRSRSPTPRCPTRRYAYPPPLHHIREKGQAALTCNARLFCVTLFCKRWGRGRWASG